MGFDVTDAAQGQEALHQLHTGVSFDVALVDWNIPTMNGLEFVVAARGDERFREISIVMRTPETEIAQVMRALDAGATEYIMKPFTIDTLRGQLELIGMPVA